MSIDNIGLLYCDGFVEKSGGVEEKVFLKSEVHIGKMIYWRIIS